MIKNLLLFLCISASAMGQSNYQFFVRFTDKNNSPYSVGTPTDYLSAKAITRRTNQNIAIDLRDIPVNSFYIDSVRNKGAQVLNASKWLNGVAVTCDSATIADIETLPFVQGTVRIKRVAAPHEGSPKFPEVSSQPVANTSEFRTASFNYGSSFNQIHLMKGEYLHDAGFGGQGMTIALLDAGFYHVDQLTPFDSMRNGGQILGTWDFVANEESVYEDDTHGMEVLSCIAGNVPGQLVGTAPYASFWLLRSEDGPTENIIEEYNWVTAAEFADSVGADLISSSLGYSIFDSTFEDHSYADMNGNTCPSSIGADIAASRGLLVLVSAGNSGNGAWHYITAPSDGDSVLCIGAVDSDGFKVGFSSWGPSSDGDVKPNVAAQGSQVTLSDPAGNIGAGSGTSFSCPILAGSAACLWQAHPDKTNMEIFHAIEASANYYHNPGDSLGYGIPDFMTADLLLGGTMLDKASGDNLIGVYPNPCDDYLGISYYSATTQTLIIQVCDALGRVASEQKTGVGGGFVAQILLKDISVLKKGIYFIRIEAKEKTFLRKIVKF